MTIPTIMMLSHPSHTSDHPIHTGISGSIGGNGSIVIILKMRLIMTMIAPLTDQYQDQTRAQIWTHPIQQ